MAGVEITDPSIKLFGKTIALPQTQTHLVFANHPSTASVHHPAADDQDDDDDASGFGLVSLDENNKENSAQELGSRKQGDENQITDQTISGISENPSVERETSSPKASKNEEQSETSISADKTPKKPDKILPCPRCNSMDTKFCYYNNYNVNQPRHFCKNCQRYWTAGGNMRNVPVGAGRRKNKNSSSQLRHLIIPENEVHDHHYLGNNATFLTFSSDSPKPNGFSRDNGDDHSSKSSISNSSEKGGKTKTSFQQPLVKNFFPFPPQLPPFPGFPWPYSCTPPMGTPAFYPPGFPLSYYPAPPYWGCAVPPFTGSSVLGKHSRDGKIINNPAISQEEHIKQNSSEAWIPKTLRVDDPNEAAKSSVWSTLGIANEKSSSINGGGLFAAFQAKGKEENHSDSSSLLQANPAAFSRALRFRETA